MSENKKDKDILLSIILSESATSVLTSDRAQTSRVNPCSTISSKLSPEAKEATNYEHILTNEICKQAAKHCEGKIVSDTALFSCSTVSSASDIDNLSADYIIQNENSVHSIANLPNILQPVRIFTHPLIGIRSLINLNPIFNRDPLCRICHGGNSFEDLLTPCNCRGTIAFAHLHCLERWLSESNRNECELCQYNYTIIREPMYSIPWSVLIFLRHPGENLWELLFDLFIFVVYTPTAVISTFMLMSLCENISMNNFGNRKSLLTHFLAFVAILGIGTIDFTYSTWLTVTLQKYFKMWSQWYKRKCLLKVVLSTNKLKAGKERIK